MDEGRPRQTRNYVSPNDSEPFRDWIKKLKDYVGRGRIQQRLNRIRANGNFGDWKAIKDSDGIVELRIDTGPGYRVYLAEDGELDQIIFLLGGDKSTQDADIAKAKEYWKEYNDA